MKMLKSYFARAMEEWQFVKRIFWGLSCPLCGSRGMRHLTEGHWNRYAECSRCGMIFVEKMPSRRELETRYRQGYIEQRKEFFGQPDEKPWDAGWVKDRSEIFARFLPAYEKIIGPRGMALEIGCAEGRQMEILAERGWDVMGVEIGEDMVQEGLRRGLNIIQGAIEEAEFSNNTFHLVVMSHVIEHLINPMAVLRKAWRIMKPGGLIIIETPLLHDFGDRDHLQFFSESTMRGVLNRTGFQWLDHFVHEYEHKGIGHRNIIVCAKKQ